MAPNLRDHALVDQFGSSKRLSKSRLSGLIVRNLRNSFAFYLALCFSAATSAQTAPPTGSIKVVSGQPDSVVFINNIRHGATDESGSLTLSIKPGTYSIRVRTVGFVDWKGTVTVALNSRRDVTAKHVPTNDQAVIHYQKGDQLRARLKHRDAIKEYEQALQLRPAFPEARIAMARSLIPLQAFQEAEKQIDSALNNYRGPYPEAQTVLANLRRQQGLLEESITAYKVALTMAKGQSPEAHIGLAIALNESEQVDASIKEYRIGIVQNMDTEPILYYQLGSILEKEGRNMEAIEAYQNYIRLDPMGELVSAVESIIELLKR
jgi:tetratricopeptide (TPR) repeat protein